MDEDSINDHEPLLAELWGQPEAYLDFKAPFKFGKANLKSTLGLIKDIIGMANADGGGYLIIGKDDNGNAIDCDQEIIDSFDATKVHDLSQKYASPDPIFFVHDLKSPAKTRAVLIVINEFKESPIICKLSAQDPKKDDKLLLRKGAIYIRSKTGSARTNEISTEEDMRCLLNRAIMRGQDELILKFRGLLSNFSDSALETTKPDIDSSYWKNVKFKVESHFADIFETGELPAIDRSSLSFQISVRTLLHRNNLFNDIESLKQKVGASVFSLRGRSFPAPKFTLEDIEVPGHWPMISMRRVMPSHSGDLRLDFAVSLEGYFFYQEELPSYEEYHEKPLFIPYLFLQVYRTLKFVQDLYGFLPEKEGMQLDVSIPKTLEMLPTSSFDPRMLIANPYHNAKQIGAPVINLNQQFKLGDLEDTVKFSAVIGRKIVEYLGVDIDDEVLLGEFQELANENI